MISWKNKFPIGYILAYLNNRRVYDWLILNGIVKGSIVEFSETPVASIPYRPINWEIELEVTLHEQITNKVKAFLTEQKEIYIYEINQLFNLLFHE